MQCSTCSNQHISGNIKEVILLDPENNSDIRPGEYGIYRYLAQYNLLFLELAEKAMMDLGRENLVLKKKLYDEGLIDVTKLDQDSWFTSHKSNRARVILSKS